MFYTQQYFVKYDDSFKSIVCYSHCYVLDSFSPSGCVVWSEPEPPSSFSSLSNIWNVLIVYNISVDRIHLDQLMIDLMSTWKIYYCILKMTMTTQDCNVSNYIRIN